MGQHLSFDEGGILAPGITISADTLAPVRWFTPEQLRALERVAALLDRSKGETTHG